MERASSGAIHTNDHGPGHDRRCETSPASWISPPGKEAPVTATIPEASGSSGFVLQDRDAGDTGPLKEADCLLIKKVSPRSPAGELGLQVGDLVEAVDGRPAAARGLDRKLDPNATRTWTFVSQGTTRRRIVEAKAAPLGMDLEPTNAALLARIERGQADMAELVPVWERGDWACLEQAASALCSPNWLWGAVLTLFGHHPRDMPPGLLLGAALYERGKREAGLARILRYHRRFERYHTMQYQAIVRYYLAKEALRQGDREGALSLLLDAYVQGPMDRIGDLLEEVCGERVQKPSYWRGQPFPLDYRLPRLEGSGTVGLRETLEQLPENGFLTVCLLATYRANGPYDDFLQTFAWQRAHFPQALPRLHVLTMERNESEFARAWLRTENSLHRKKFPLDVLHEADGELTMTLDPPGSPYVLTLDREGQIVGEGVLDEVELWDLLSGHRS
jgi:hypothetical protein